jgi:WD40 repeat protein/serine/threonine protein kinase/tetratricopeptide (TPR) repeat protein
MAETFTKEEAIFHAALEIDSAEQRSAYLDAACANQEELRRRVEALLRRHAEAEGPLERPVIRLATTSDAPGAERPGTVIGPYKLLEQIGEGGMGLVFMADQLRPVRRRVAFKVLKPGLDTRQVVARFEAERQALALMDHPHIAKVFDAGTTETSRPYFVMELVRGVPITEFCDQRRLTTRQRLELFALVCQAVQHAHQKGIIHRDLKPSNVLVTLHDTVAVPKVIDFGIAKATSQPLTERTLFTHFAQMVGTPLYMSPEQAEMNSLDVDTRSDIYSLGVLLYELLTGTTPFDKDRLKELAYDEMRRIIREEEPPKPSTRISTLAQAATSVATQRKSDAKRLSQLVRGELDWIVMKALEKDRNRRYETASAFAADVQRYLADEPVHACPPSAWYRFRKFARRNKGALAIAAATALAGVLALLGLSVSYAQIDAARGQAEANAKQERAARGAAGKAQKQAEAKAEESRQRLVRLTVAQGVRLMDEGNLLGSLPWFAEALRLDQGDPGREAIHRIRLGAVLRQCPRLIQVWDETELAQFSPDGQRVVTAHRRGKTARIWDAASGVPLTAPLRLEEAVADVAFQGQRCYAATINGKAARVWDVVSGKPLTPPLKHDAQVKMASFSPDGWRVATWCADNTVRVWEGTKCRLVTQPLYLERLADGEIKNVAPNAGSLRPWFSADSRHLLLLNGNQVQVWDVAKGQLITTLDAGYFYCAALSHDGRRIATGSRYSTLLSLWDVTNGGRLIGSVYHGNSGGSLNGLSFSGDGRHLVTANDKGTAQACDTATLRPLAPPLKHGAAVNGAWFSPDGRHVVTASKDGTARVWAAATGQALAPPLLHSGPVESAAFSPDGRLVLTWAVAPGGARVVRLWDMAPAETVPPHKDSLPGFDWLRMSGEAENFADRIIVARLKGQPVRLWDSVSGIPLSAPLKPSGRVHYAEFSHDRSRLLTWSLAVPTPGWIGQVWDPTTGQPVGPQWKDLKTFSHLSPDGRRMVCMNKENTTQVWNVATGQPLGPPLKSACDTRFGQDAAFSPDGRWMVIREDATVRLWDGRAAQAITLLPRHSDGVVQASFSLDSCRLVTASADGTACVWDVVTGRLLCAPVRHGCHRPGAALSADSRLVATLCKDGMIRVWDTATGEPVTPRFPTRENSLGIWPQYVVFSPAGYHLLGRLNCGGQREWDLAPDGRPVKELISFAEVLSGHRIDPVSGLVPLEAERFQRAWTDLRARYPQCFASSPQAALTWHAEQAGACLQEKQWAAAIWHLDHLIAAEPKQWGHHYHRGCARAELKQWDQAIADYSRAIELTEEDGYTYTNYGPRGDAYAVQRQWDKAAADYARAVQGWPDGNILGLWYPHALLRLTVGDAKGYRQACRKLLEGAGGSVEPAQSFIAGRVVWACVVAPDALDDYAPLLILAEKAVTLDRHNYPCARALGGALLRAGRLEPAVKQLQKALSLQPGATSASLLLAMAHHRLGHADDARRWLDKAVQKIEQVFRQRPKNAGSEATAVAPDELLWTERLSLQLLRREAEALIRGPAAKGKKSPAEKK